MRKRLAWPWRLASPWSLRPMPLQAKITACTNAEELVQYMVGAREDAAA